MSPQCLLRLGLKKDALISEHGNSQIIVKAIAEVCCYEPIFDGIDGNF